MAANPVVLTIATALTPFVGQMMARSSVEMHCKRLGLDASKLEGSELDRLLHQIALGLNVFIGRDKSEAVLRDIRTSIGSEKK
jgi:hypothetical protein